MKVYPGQNDVVQSGTSIHFGGTLSVLFDPGSLTAGNSWKLFNAPPSALSGSFTLSPSSPGAGLAWDASQLATSGILSVVSTAGPQIAGLTVTGGYVYLAGTNGPQNGNYVVLSSTNVGRPLSMWDRLVTNPITGPHGSFTWTNAVNPGEPARFYRLQSQ